MNRTIPTLLLVGLLAFAASAQIGLQVTSPADGATVQGQIVIAGTTTGLTATGRVAVSVAGGPFQMATGTASWTFQWDTTTLADGPVVVRVRARQTIQSPPVFVALNLVVANSAPAGPAVAFLSPADGATVLDTTTVIGTSMNATVVELSVDGGPFNAVNGLDPWNEVFEPGSLAPGAHVLTARASDGAAFASDTLNIIVGTPPPGGQSFTYVSSVDGEAMTSQLWLPQGFDPSTGDRPLVVFLHGGGGTGITMTSNTAFTGELDARGWIGVAPDGRAWGLAQQGCTWQTSAAYVDNPDPNVGPGEQDIFDAIDWAVANLPIDTDRIYLTGFSMGGRGTYIIGLKNPDRFAAIGPMGPASDMYEIFVRRPNPPECKEGMTGGQPGDSLFVDTMYTITSGRFLIENAYNLPVFHGHGLNDGVASNTLASSDYLHGFHMTDDTTFNACHGTTNLCFGHTPTLSELAARHPGAYDWAYMFSPVGHSIDPLWLTGTPSTAGILGTPDPGSPGDLIGLFDFFASRSQVVSPDSVVYKTYTDTHTRAYWLEISSSVPWTDTPAAARVTRDIGANALTCEVVRASELRFDLARAGLSLTSAQPLTIDLEELVEPIYDPALAAVGETLAPSVVLDLGGPAPNEVVVLRDGVPLAAADVTVSGNLVTVATVHVVAPTTLEVFACAGYYAAYGDGFAGSGGITPRLIGGGCPSPGETFTAEIVDGLGGAPAALLVGVDTTQTSLVTGGDLLVGPVDELLVASIGLAGSGPGGGSLLLPVSLPAGLPSFVFTLQAAVVDGGSTSGYSLTNGLFVQVD